jgi:release factor glutamine methyltransferase
VRDWEPRSALLDDGQTERLAAAARAALHGWLVLEIHEERAPAISGTLTELGYRDVAVAPDLAGRPRVVSGRWS